MVWMNLILKMLKVGLLRLMIIVVFQFMSILKFLKLENNIQYLKKNYNLLIGELTAEDIKINIGSAFALEKEVSMDIKGRDLVAGVPKNLKLSSVQVREALAETIDTIVEAVRQALEQTPPELAADILDRGIILTGGGALLRGFDKRLRQETNLPVNIAEDPLTCVVRGTGKVLENMSAYTKVLEKSRRN